MGLEGDEERKEGRSTLLTWGLLVSEAGGVGG